MTISLFIGDLLWESEEYPNWHPDPRTNRGIIKNVQWGEYGNMVLFFRQDVADTKSYRLIKAIPEGQVDVEYKKFYLQVGGNYEKKLTGEIELVGEREENNNESE